MMNVKKIVYLSLLISTALVLSVIDARIPLLPALPGIKIGLANIVTLIVIGILGWKEAVLVTIVRCFLAFLFHGSPVALVLSLAGGVISTLLMSLLFIGYPKYFSLSGISIAGAVTHNLCQLTAASLIIQSGYIFSYLPYLLITGVVSGYCIGFVSKRISLVLDKNKIPAVSWDQQGF